MDNTTNEMKKAPQVGPQTTGAIGALEPEEVTKKDKFLIVTIVVIILVVLALALLGFLVIKQGPDTVQGQGEATEVRISGKLPGRVAEIYVEEGQYVHAGDTLVHIISSLADAQLTEAQALEQVAQATNQKVDAGTRSQVIQAAKEVWQQAQAGSNIAKKTYERMENLFAKGVVSAQKRDEAKAAYDVAKSGKPLPRAATNSLWPAHRRRIRPLPPPWSPWPRAASRKLTPCSKTSISWLPATAKSSWFIPT